MLESTLPFPRVVMAPGIFIALMNPMADTIPWHLTDNSQNRLPSRGIGPSQEMVQAGHTVAAPFQMLQGPLPSVCQPHPERFLRGFMFADNPVWSHVRLWHGLGSSAHNKSQWP